MKKSFKYELIVRDCSKVFHKDFEPGVLCSQVVTFTVPRKDLKSPMFLQAMYDMGDKFLKEHIEIVKTEIKGDSK